MPAERIRQIGERQLIFTDSFKETCGRLNSTVGTPLLDPDELKTAKRQALEVEFLKKHTALMVGYGELDRFDGILLGGGDGAKVDPSFWEDFVMPPFEFSYGAGKAVLEVARWYPAADGSGIMVRGNNLRMRLPGEKEFSIVNGSDGKKRLRRAGESELVSSPVLECAIDVLEALRNVHRQANVPVLPYTGQHPMRVKVEDVKVKGDLL